MNTARMGRLIAYITILLGLLFALIGGLLAYAIPASPQSFVDLMQRHLAHCPMVGSKANVEYQKVAKPLIVGGETSLDIPLISPATQPAAAPAPAAVTLPATTEPASGTVVTEIPQHPRIAPLRAPTPPIIVATYGASLGGAFGLIVGLILGIFVAIVDAIFIAIWSVWDAFRNRFLNPNTAFRR